MNVNPNKSYIQVKLNVTILQSHFYDMTTICKLRVNTGNKFYFAYF
jgi:hypothetical protein